MLIDFFYTLRDAKVPVTIKEFLTLLEALQQGVTAPSLDEFYYLARLTLATPIETDASGLVIYTQDFRVVRKLLDDGERVEHEYVVDVAGGIQEGGLALLNHGLTFSGKPINPMKVSWQSEGRLRFAAKGVRPGQIAHMCEAVGLEVTDIKRLRVGRISMGGLPEGQWRYLAEYERF